MSDSLSTQLTLVLFGATGDLAKKKIFPALYQLHQQQLLPENFRILANGRSEFSDQEFQKTIFDLLSKNAIVQFDEATANAFVSRLEYVIGDVSHADLYQQLQQKFYKQSKKGPQSIIFQLAVMPSLYRKIVEHIGQVQLFKQSGWTRLLIEKPFGENLSSALELDKALKEYFAEEQIFRIDHYLTKETVQNIFASRFGNGLFEPIWDRNFIDHIQITMLEDFGIGNRGAFYDRVGALKDVVQNHLLQVLALTTMDVPAHYTANDLRSKRQEIIKNLKVMSPEEVKSFTIRGQYQGYQQEEKVEPDSSTETFIMLRTEIETDRWQGVPIYIRAGKHLSTKLTEVSVVFKQNQRLVCPDLEGIDPQANVLQLRLAPNEGIGLRFLAKKPGQRMVLTPASMDFSYATLQQPLMESYAKVLLDTIKGDQTLFATSQEVEYQWQFITPILTAWQKEDVKLFTYERGSDGPKEADLLMEREGRRLIK